MTVLVPQRRILKPRLSVPRLNFRRLGDPSFNRLGVRGQPWGLGRAGAAAAQSYSDIVLGTQAGSLEAYWELEEASGNRADSKGSNTLTDNATVTSATGKVGTAAKFTNATQEYLSIADNASLSLGDIDFTIAAWVYLDHLTDDVYTIFADWQVGGSNQKAFLLEYSSGATDRFLFYVSDDGTNTRGPVTANNFGAALAETWYFVIAWHDATANTINIQINNGAVDSDAYVLGVHNSDGDKTLGRRATKYVDARIDEVALWKTVLTGGEKTVIYEAA